MPIPKPEIKLSRGRPLSMSERYLERALHFFEKKKYAEAIADLDEAIAIEKRNGELYATRGLAMFMADFDKAEIEADLAKALKIDPRQWLSYYTRGMMAFKGGEYGAAIGHFNQALQIDPERPEILIYRAAAQYALNEKERAKADITKVDEMLDKSDKRSKDMRKWRSAINKL